MNKDSVRFYVAAVDNEGFVACSTEEPVFCYVRATEEDAVRAAEQTFDEYARLFLKEERRAKARPLPDLKTLLIGGRRAYELQVA